MPQIRRIRKRIIKKPDLEDEIPVVDAVAVKARLSSFMARWVVYAICIVLGALVTLVYGQVLTHKFIELGDKSSVYGNPVVTSGLKSGAIGYVFTHADYHTGGFYAPLTMITHMADWSFNNQLDDKAAGNHHLVNLLLHGTTVILLFLTLRLITGAIWRSAFVAALFAIHPLQVESVAWVAERGSMLCGLFFILAIDAYVRYVYRPWSLVRYSSVLALFVLGLLCEPTMLALPFVLLLLDYWPLSRFTQPVFANAGGPYRQDFPSVFVRLFAEKIPFFAISFVVFVKTHYAQKLIHTSLDTFSFPVQVTNAMVSCLTYIIRTFYPAGLTVFYPQGSEPKLFFEVCFAFLVLAATSAAAFFLRKKHPYFIVGWFWFLGMLAPAIAWGEGGLFAGADRYAYLPLIGLYFIIAWGGWDLLQLLPGRGWFAAGCMITAVTALVVCARIQCSYWQDGISLWTHALDVTHDNYVAYDNLGNALVENGRIDEALVDYQKALTIHPSDAEAEDDTGIALDQKQDFDQAMIHYEKALNIRHNYPEAWIDMGKALVEKGDIDDAIAIYRKASDFRPDYTEAHYNLGMAFAQKSKTYLPGNVAQFEKTLAQAIDEFRKALEIRSYYPEAHFNLALALTQQGALRNLPEAIRQYKEALDLRPSYAEADFCLGGAYFQNGELDNAIAQWRKALELRPNYEEVHYDLGLALAQKGELDEAIEEDEKALELGPNYADIYRNIANAMWQKKEFQKAIDNYKKALEIQPDFPGAKNELAWLLATCPNPALRDGKKAVELVEKDALLYGNKYPLLLRTLAAAYAQDGRYKDAVQTATQALQALQAFGPNADPEIGKGLQRELKLYQAGSPYRETP